MLRINHQMNQCRRVKNLMRWFFCLSLLLLMHGCSSGGSSAPPPSTYSIGGTVTGLADAKSVVLKNNGTETKSVSVNGDFTFDTAQNDATAYSVSVETQPSNQICTVANGSGTLAGGDISTVTVSCVSTFTVGGTVTGLASGKNIVLQNNGGDNKTITVDSSFTFDTVLFDATTYSVTVATQPANQNCTIGNGAGTLAGSNITNISVSCVNTYTIGGTVTGLASNESIVLKNNGGDTKTITVDDTFTFDTALESGTDYNVSIATQPGSQACSLSGGTGTANANVDTVSISCETHADPKGYYKQGTLSVGPGGVITDDALQAIVNGNRIMMVSVTHKILYDATLTVSGDSFTADVVIYTDGIKSGDGTMTGTIESGKQITGELIGTGNANGSYTLTYALSNSDVADFSNISNNTWDGKTGDGADDLALAVLGGIGIGNDAVITSGIFIGCDIDGTADAISVINDSNLYNIVDFQLTTCDSGFETPNGNYTGFATLEDPYTTMLLMVVNGSYAIYWDFIHR